MFNKNGITNINTSSQHYIVNNFSETGTKTDWTLGGDISNGIAVLTGGAPTILSKDFTVNPTDVLCFEFTVAVPTPSTTTSGPGLYLGTKYGQTVKVWTYNFSTRSYTGGGSTTNPYFMYSYNSTEKITMKTYILGSSVDINKIPFADCTNTSITTRVLQLTTDTTTNIRSGYNGNTSMVIHFSNPRIYNIQEYGFCENSKTKFGKGYIQSNNFYEI